METSKKSMAGSVWLLLAIAGGGVLIAIAIANWRQKTEFRSVQKYVRDRGGSLNLWENGRVLKVELSTASLSQAEFEDLVRRLYLAPNIVITLPPELDNEENIKKLNSLGAYIWVR